MIRFLVTGGEPAEYQNVLVRNLVETAAFEADPVSVLFDLQVEGLPVGPSLDIVLLD